MRENILRKESTEVRGERAHRHLPNTRRQKAPIKMCSERSDSDYNSSSGVLLWLQCHTTVSHKIPVFPLAETTILVF